MLIYLLLFCNLKKNFKYTKKLGESGEHSSNLHLSSPIAKTGCLLSFFYLYTNTCTQTLSFWLNHLRVICQFSPLNIKDCLLHNHITNSHPRNLTLIKYYLLTSIHSNFPKLIKKYHIHLLFPNLRSSQGLRYI